MNLLRIACVANEESAVAGFGQPRGEMAPWLGQSHWLRLLVLSVLTASLALLALGAWAHQLPAWLLSGLLATSFVVVLGLLEWHARCRAWRGLGARRRLSPCPEVAATARLTADDETEAFTSEDLTGEVRRLSA